MFLIFISRPCGGEKKNGLVWDRRAAVLWQVAGERHAG
jgi:hypothetical protein